MIKESKIDELVVCFTEWVKNIPFVGMSLSRALHWVWNSCELTMDLTNLNKAIKMTKKEEIDALSSKIIHAQTKTMFLGSNMHVMMQALEEGGSSHLPHGLSIMNTYTKMATWSKWVVVMVKNLTTTLIIITKGVKVSWVIAANAIPQIGFSIGILEKLNEMQGSREQRYQLSRERKCSSSSWTCMAWRCGLPRIELPHMLYYLTWNPESWAALIWQNMRSKSLMTNPSMRGPGEFIHLWKMRFMLMWKRCWKLVQFTQARTCGAMLLCWYTRKMEVYASASISIKRMWEQRRTFIHTHGYRKPLKAWLAQGTFPA